MGDDTLEFSAQRVLDAKNDPCRLESLGNAGGFSGSCIWISYSSSGKRCLKAWPSEFQDPNHLRKIHRWMRLADKIVAPDFLPFVYEIKRAQTFVAHSNRLWD